MNHPHRHGAFTLLEILATVAILAVLAALAIPLAGSAIDSARKAQSLSNIRNIGMAVTMYSQDNNGLLVHAQDVPGSGDRFSNVLQNTLEGNSPGTPAWVSASGVSDAFRCPAYDNKGKKWKTGFGMYQYLFAYFKSGDYTQANQPNKYGSLRMLNFPYPSRTIIVGSAPDHVVDARRSTGFNLANSSPTRHGKTANYLFLDGHVQSLTPEEALKIFP